MALILENIITYLKNSTTIVLTTVDHDNLPDIRTIGGYNFDGYILYFATSNTSEKVKQLQNNYHVTILVQHENQTLPNYRNITIYGSVKRLSGPEYAEGRTKLLEKRPDAVYEEESRSIYKVIPEKIKILDLSKKENEQILVIKP